jgi:hypothetical protein
MGRWDRLVEEYRARGVSAAPVEYTQVRLDRSGRWLKRRRPRIAIEQIDAELLTRYIASCSRTDPSGQCPPDDSDASDCGVDALG